MYGDPVNREETITVVTGETRNSIVLNDLLYGDYTVTEVTDQLNGTNALTGWTWTGVAYDKQSVSLKDAATKTASVTATNTYTRDLANLTVTKVFKNLTDDEVARLTNFKLSVTGPSDYPGTELVLSQETKVVGAKHPTYTWTLVDVPTGTYTVSETRKDVKLPEYSLTVKNAQGGDIITASDDVFTQQTVLEKDGEKAVYFQNAYTRQLGTLEITKQVAPDGPASVYDATYTFDIQAEDFLLKDVAGKTIDGVTFDAAGKATVSIDLSQETSKTIQGLPTGTYTVTERNAEVEYWDWTVAGTGPAAVNNNETAEVTVTNTYERSYIPEEPEDLLAQLTIRKLVEDDAGNSINTNHTYTFIITGQDVYGDDPVVKKVTVQGGESETVELIYGTYTVTEDTTDVAIPDYTFRNVTYSNHEDLAMLDADTAAATATVTNIYQRNTVSVTVEKRWGAGATDRQRPVTMHLLADGVEIRQFVLDGTVDNLETEAWKATFQDLPESEGGVLIDYTVTEDSLGEGWGQQITETAGVDSYAFLVTNRYYSGGGDGGDDGEDIPDEDPPTTDLPDEDPPTTDLPDEETPTTDLPDEETPTTEDPLEEIPEDDVPLAEAPATGDNLVAWIMAAAVSGIGLIWLAITGRKRKDEQGE